MPEVTIKVPTMITIREAARRTGVSYDFVWKLCRSNQIVYIRAGKKFLVNFEKFVEFLNNGTIGGGTS